ncbi:hypothetical protein GCM10012320_07310 [Sinomonas cellulolyticus]|nr:hypothetical protein GCM10012320_07310 [Sinomonas sp. KCTC 49339]
MKIVSAEVFVTSPVRNFMTLKVTTDEGIVGIGDATLPHEEDTPDYLHPGDQPGLGVEFNEEAANSFPYQQAYLPYNRLIDGTVHDW